MRNFILSLEYTVDTGLSHNVCSAFCAGNFWHVSGDELVEGSSDPSYFRFCKSLCFQARVLSLDHNGPADLRKPGHCPNHLLHLMLTSVQTSINCVYGRSADPGARPDGPLWDPEKGPFYRYFLKFTGRPEGGLGIITCDSLDSLQRQLDSEDEAGPREAGPRGDSGNAFVKWTELNYGHCIWKFICLDLFLKALL